MHDLKPTEKIVQVLLELANHPFGKTQEALAEHYNLSTRQVRRYFAVLRSCGFIVEGNSKGLYKLERENHAYEELSDLLHFSEEDNLLLSNAIASITVNTEKRERLLKKLMSVYDFERLGYAYLTSKNLEQLNLLRHSCEQQHQIILRQYRSTNSMDRRDRVVEVFHVEPAEDKFYAYEPASQANRMFKFSRMEAAEITDQPWQYQHLHQMMTLDPFRIFYERQVDIDLRLDLAAFNYLQDYFPIAANTAKPEGQIHYRLQCPVNAAFIGVTNFVLANAGHVEVLAPDAFKAHLNDTIKNLTF